MGWLGGVAYHNIPASVTNERDSHSLMNILNNAELISDERGLGMDPMQDTLRGRELRCLRTDWH